MTALATCGEEIATAMPLPFIITECMIVVLPSEIEAEFRKGNAVSFSSIALGFLNLADQAGLHTSPFKAEEHHPKSVVLFLSHTRHILSPMQAISS
jgi:hypothetical protein